MSECIHKQKSGKAVGLDGVVMEAIIWPNMETRSWLYTYAYCLTTLLNFSIFPIVLCNLLLLSSLYKHWIEVFKITHDIYDPDASLKLVYHSDSITRGNKYKLSNHRFHYTYESIIFLHVLLKFGIVYLTMLSMLILLTFFKTRL